MCHICHVYIFGFSGYIVFRVPRWAEGVKENFEQLHKAVQVQQANVLRVHLMQANARVSLDQKDWD